MGSHCQHGQNRPPAANQMLTKHLTECLTEYAHWNKAAGKHRRPTRPFEPSAPGHHRNSRAPQLNKTPNGHSRVDKRTNRSQTHKGCPWVPTHKERPQLPALRDVPFGPAVGDSPCRFNCGQPPYSSSASATSAAQARASAMALTTSELPLRASPATYTGVAPAATPSTRAARCKPSAAIPGPPWQQARSPHQTRHARDP